MKKLSLIFLLSFVSFDAYSGAQRFYFCEPVTTLSYDSDVPQEVLANSRVMAVVESEELVGMYLLGETALGSEEADYSFYLSMSTFDESLLIDETGNAGPSGFLTNQDADLAKYYHLKINGGAERTVPTEMNSMSLNIQAVELVKEINTGEDFEFIAWEQSLNCK